MSKFRYVALWPIALCCLLLTLLFLDIYSGHGRIYLKNRFVEAVKAPQDCLNLWENKGLRGRVLFLFDRHLNAEDGIVGLKEDTYVDIAVKRNVIRKIYHIVPDNAWNDVQAALSVYPLVRRVHGYFRFFLLDGTTVFVMKIGDITQIDESVLLHVNGSYWSREQLSEIAGLVKKNVLSSDFITLTGDVSIDIVNEFNVI